MHIKYLLFILLVASSSLYAAAEKELSPEERQEIFVHMFAQSYAKYLCNAIAPFYMQALMTAKKESDLHTFGEGSFLKVALPDTYAQILKPYKELLCSASDAGHAFLCAVQQSEKEEDTFAAFEKMSNAVAIKIVIVHKLKAQVTDLMIKQIEGTVQPLSSDSVKKGYEYIKPIVNHIQNNAAMPIPLEVLKPIYNQYCNQFIDEKCQEWQKEE